MINQIKENLLITLTHEEMTTAYRQAEALLNALNEDGFFTNINYAETVPGQWCWGIHTGYLSDVAKNKKILQKPEYVEKILKALRIFLSEKRTNENWWHEQIGLPMRLGYLYLLLEDKLSDDDKKAMLPYIEAGSITLHPEVLTSWDGCNLSWGVLNSLIYAVILEDETYLQPALEAAATTMKIQENNAEGIQDDFSFFQHQTQFHTTGYGVSYVESMAKVIYALQGTEYQFTEEQLTVYAYFLFFGVRYCVRNKHKDFLTVGRAISRPNAVGATDELRKAIWLIMQVENMPCINALQEQLASFCSELYTPRGNRFFWKSNYFSCRTTNTHIGCKCTSPLYSMGETLNDENMLSANLYAGGATCIMVDGKEYDNIFPLWDFARIPGTTAPLESDEELEDIIPLWHGKNADNTYAKGLAHGDYGVIYQDVNFNGVTGVISRFFMDGIMVALGAGLSYKGDKQVTTTLNQCHQYDTTLTSVDGLPENSLYQGRVAYANLDDNALQCIAQEKEGNWNRIERTTNLAQNANVFTAFIDHGIAPNNASYAYAVIPGVAPANAAERITDVTKQITVLRNDDAVQAIRYKNKIIVVFHKAGTFNINPVNKIEATEHSTYFLDV